MNGYAFRVCLWMGYGRELPTYRSSFIIVLIISRFASLNSLWEKSACWGCLCSTVGKLDPIWLEPQHNVWHLVFISLGLKRTQLEYIVYESNKRKLFQNLAPKCLLTWPIKDAGCLCMTCLFTPQARNQLTGKKPIRETSRHWSVGN